MKKTIYLLFLVCFVITLKVNAQESIVSDRLEKLWETTAGLRTTESVLYDPTEQVIFVSSINEKPWEKDKNGYITRHNTDGKILNYEWIKELSAPKGMGLLQGKLYVTDIDEVVEIDIEKAKINQRFKHPRAINLNDIAVGADGRIFVSDSKGEFIFEISNGVLDILTETDGGPVNGLFYETGRLLCGQDNRVAVLDLNTKTMSTFIDDTGPIDGIKGVGDSTYLISDWTGKVHLIQKDKPKELLLDLSGENINAADIEYNPYDRVLYVPTFFNNSVAAYKLKEQ